MFNEDCPSVLPRADRIIAIGDVHGDVERLLECLYATKIIDTNGVWIAEPRDTIVVQVGDQIDSLTRVGNPNWERLPDYEVIYFMDKLDRQARLHGGRVISLIGNHEIMNTLGDFSYVSTKSRDDLRYERFRPGGSIATLLSHKCVIVKIGTMLFVHGGILPGHVEMFNSNIHMANDIIRKYLRNDTLTDHEQHVLQNGIVGDNGIVWTRVFASVSDDVHTMLERVLEMTGCKAICTGHNTLDNITPMYDGKLWYLDSGFSRAFGKDSFQALEILDDGSSYNILNFA